MAKYRVRVMRTEYGSCFIEFDAKNEKEAREKALVVAGDYEFPCHDADYKVDVVYLLNRGGLFD